MADIVIRSFTPDDSSAILDLQVRYAAVFPGPPVVPPPVYTGPGFDEGRNVLCAVAPDGTLLGYAAVYVDAAPTESGHRHVLWSVLKPDPALTDPRPVREALYTGLMARLAQLKPVLPSGDVEVCFEVQPVESAAMDFAVGKGFAHVSTAYRMVRDLAAPIETVPVPAGLEVRPWKLAAEDEQRCYLEARNRCFAHQPWSLETLRFLLTSPLWQEGASITAFAGDAVAGSVLVYWDEAANARAGRSSGYTEEVFVLPEWRGRGLGRCLLGEALRYLRDHGLAEAELQVLVSNDGALGLYRGLGYRVVSETLHVARKV